MSIRVWCVLGIAPVIISTSGCATQEHTTANAGLNVRVAVPQATDGVRQAAAAASSAQTVVLTQLTHTMVARYNPAKCACPPFELLLGDHWQRFFLTPPADETGQITRLRDTARELDEKGQFPLYLLEARVSTDRKTAVNNLEYGVLVVSKHRLVGAMSPLAAWNMGFDTPLPKPPAPPAPVEPPPEDVPPTDTNTPEETDPDAQDDLGDEDPVEEPVEDSPPE